MVAQIRHLQERLKAAELENKELRGQLTELADAVAAEVDAKPGFGGSGYLLARLTDARHLLKAKTPAP